MKKRTRFFAFFLAFLIVILASFSGCGNGEGDIATGGEAGEKSEIVIGYVGPFTGPLSVFTVAFDWVTEKALEEINADGGIYIEAYDKKLPVRVIKGDSESNATKASEIASKFVLDHNVDILAASWTPETSAPVSAVAERYTKPCLISNSPADSWLEGGPFKWSYGLMFYVESMMASYIDGLDKLDTNKKVGFLFDSEVDGVTFSALLKKMLPERGYEIVDPGRFAMATTDYTNIITQLKEAECDIVMGNQILPDFTTAWQQFKQLSYVPKAMVIGKAIAYGSDVVALGGDLGVGLITEIHWDRSFPYTSSLLGLSCEEFASLWESENNSQYPATSLGYDLALFEVLDIALNNCKDLESATIRDQIAAVSYEGIYGKLSFDENNVMNIPIVAGQWLEGETWDYEPIIIGPGNFPIIPAQDPIILPGTTRQ